MNRQALLNGFIFVTMLLIISACGGTKLLDIEKTANTLNLSEMQRNVMRFKVQQIEEIVEDYELEKETLEAGVAERRNQMRGGVGSVVVDVVWVEVDLADKPMIECVTRYANDLKSCTHYRQLVYRKLTMRRQL